MEERSMFDDYPPIVPPCMHGRQHDERCVACEADWRDAPPMPTEVRTDDPIQARFVRFHSAHPEVYAGLVELAREGVAAGRSKLGMKMLFEVLRWNRTLAGLPAEGEEFKLSNDFTSRYARLVMENEPDLDGLFDLRELRSQ